MVSLEGAEGLDDLPRRIFLEGEQRPFSDPDGFIRPIEGIVPVRDLLACSATLVIAPPWTGKTFVSKQINGALSRSGCLCARTSFEPGEAPGRTSRLLPSWWPSWQEGGSPAWWLVDALDEDDRREDRRAREIIDLVGDLAPEVRSRLHLILFCRLSEVPLWCDDLPGLRRFRLAGADRETAKILVGSERFDRVCELIRRNGLQSLASLPIVLEYLRDKAVDTELTEESVWRGVLKDLLHDQRSGPWRSERFEAAQRLAAISTFCGEKALLDLSALETLFLSGLPLPTDLRPAAGEVLKRSAAFEPAENGFRFAQEHVRQWLAAFALQEMPLSRVKPLLTLDSGEPDPRHKGLMSFLARISRHPEVRDWIIETHGGLPDPESVPWSLEGAIHALDRLQENARRSPWGLRLWGEERLASFGIEGMGEEIARRLEGDLRPAEQQLLLDVALAVEAREALPVAMQLIRDPARDGRVRAQAADFVARLGGREDLGPLAEWARAQAATGRKDRVLPALAYTFYEKGLWTFEEAVEVALSAKHLGGGWLQDRLAENLSLDRASWLLEKHVLLQPSLLAQDLAERALRTMLGQEPLSEKHFELLIALALRFEDIEDAQLGLGHDLLRFLEQSTAVRRDLFLAGLRHDPQRQSPSFHGWTWALRGEDSDWLLDLIRERGGEPDWLWTMLFHLSVRGDCHQGARRRARSALRGAQPDLLQRLERESMKWKRDQRSRQQKKLDRQSYRLEPRVRQLLDNPELNRHELMVSLARLCFTSRGDRPPGLDGRWEDLPAALQGAVLDTCRQALEACSPTAIPYGQSFSSWILWEAVCFDHLAKEDEAFALTSDMIRKWLPALLRAWDSSSEYEGTLRRCFAVDRPLSEEVFFEAIHRALRSESGRIYIIQELPTDLWSERFACMLEEIILGEVAQIEARVDLFRRLQRIFPDRTCSIAHSWVRSDLPALRDTGIDALLLLNPDEGWSLLKGLIGQEDPLPVLRRMPSLHDLPYGLRIDFASWPAARLVELEKLLYRSLPPENDPKLAAGEGRALDVDDDLRSLRGKLLRLLHGRGQDGDQEALDRLAYDHPRISRWLTQTLAEEAAEQTIAGSGGPGRPRSSSPGRFVPLEDMVRLLRDVRFRLLRTTDDLLDVVLEEIQQIQVHARQHLSMLYFPQPLKKGEKRKRLHEDALQAYIHCRLSDRLPSVLGNRETLAARNTRNDLKIQAPSIEGSRLTVIIEVKWSDHRDVSTSLVHQLGEDYLLENGLTHGIYLVGWAGPTRNWQEREACEAELTGQAQLFCQAHPEIRITPVVLDLSWSPAT